MDCRLSSVARGKFQHIAFAFYVGDWLEGEETARDGEILKQIDGVDPAATVRLRALVKLVGVLSISARSSAS